MQLTVHIDGGSRGNPGPAAAGVAIANEDGKALFEAGYFLGRMTNNSAEYYGLIRALDVLSAWPDAELTILADSELLVKQITGEYRVKSPQLAGLFEDAQRRLLRRDHWRIQHVRRAHNARADELANRAMDAEKDVVVVDRRPGAAPPKPGNGDGSTPESGEAAATLPTVIATCTSSAESPPCYTACKAGAKYEFSAVAPEGICLDALSSMLHTVLSLRDTRLAADEPVPALTIRCFKPGCGAVFELATHRPA